MIIFHSRQSGCGRRVRKKAYVGALQIRVTNCTAKLHNHFHEARKIVCNNLSSAVQAHVMKLFRYAKHALPLSFVRFLRLANGSSKNWRSPARRSRNGRESSGKTSGEKSRPISLICRAIAGQWQTQCQQMSARQLARQLASWRAMVTQCPHRSPHNNRCNIPRNIAQDDLPEFSRHLLKYDSQKL